MNCVNLSKEQTEQREQTEQPKQTEHETSMLAAMKAAGLIK